MIPIGASNEFFYYTQSGEDAVFDIVHIAEFHEDIDKEALAESVEAALKLFPEFAVRPVIKDGSLCYEENHAPAPIFDDERVSYFGTDDTNGYLFRFTCSGKTLVISCFHGLSDGIGQFVFFRTFLYFYLKNTGRKMPEGEEAVKKLGIRITEKDLPDMNRPDTMDPYRAFGNADCKPEWSYDNPGAFVVPEAVPGDNENKFPVSYIDLRLSNLLKKTKEYGVSVVPMLATLFARAVDKTFDRKGKPINIMSPVNLRTQFDTQTLVNMSDAVILPVDSEMLSASISECAVKIKNIMRAQLTKNTFCSTMAAKTAAVDDFEKMNLFEAAREGSTLPPSDEWCPVTLAFTYPGKIDLPEEYDGLLDNMYARSVVRVSGIAGTTFGNNMRIQLIGQLTDIRIVNAIISEFADIGIESSYVDCGLISGNKMVLEKLSRR